MATQTDFITPKIGLSTEQLTPFVQQATKGADDGELFIENVLSESVVLDDGEIKSTSFNNSMGFGLRRVVDEFQAYVYGNEINKNTLSKAATELAQAAPGNGTLDAAPGQAEKSFYAPISPLGADYDLPRRIKLAQDVDAYLRGKDNRVRQVQVVVSGTVQDVTIVRPDGHVASDRRPMVVFLVRVTMDDGKRRETGSAAYSRREGYGEIFGRWQAIADEAYTQTDTLMQSIPCPAGQMPVILGAGGSGVIFHEAIGHGLEGDLIREGSVFSGKMGEQVASKGVTIVDEGTTENSRGSINIDDEGTPSQHTTLIEDGKLVGYINDRLNGRKHGTGSTGNGRRQSYRHRPLVRMRNTYMLGGDASPQDIISSTKGKAIYAVDYSGGQVDTSSGKFVFQATEAYLIENGKIVAPVKGATLIGSCTEGLQNIDMIGNDMRLETGPGTCGKKGQGMPVNHGMPTVRMTKGVTIGGTEG